jgi:hypothetical protein
MQSKEIMCSEDFERAFHVRLAEKCCANCKHGEREYEGFATCSHPKRNDVGYVDEEGESKYYTYNAHQCDVCDLWEVKGEIND